MYNRKSIDAYRQTDAHTMTREKLIVLLYEKMVSDLLSAQTAAKEGSRLRMTKKLSHSQMIISDLRGALDHDIGGDITRNLETLYDYLFREHLQMLVDLDPSHADNCLQVIEPLLASWRKVPVGTGDKAARDYARGQLAAAPGTDPASRSGRSISESHESRESRTDQTITRQAGTEAAVPSEPSLTSVSA